MPRERATLRLRDDDARVVAWSLGSDGALELAMRGRDDDAERRLFANCYSRAWLNTLTSRARGDRDDDGATRDDDDGANVIVGLLREASREGSSSARADALSLKDLERLRDGGGEARRRRRRTREEEEDDVWYLVLTHISVQGAKTHYPLPLERVPTDVPDARTRAPRKPPKSTPTSTSTSKPSPKPKKTSTGEPSTSSVEERLREELKNARAETRALRRAVQELVKEREKARAERAESTAKMVELRAELESAKERETNTRVRLRETEATLRSVQRMRRAGEHRSTRAVAVAGARSELVAAKRQTDAEDADLNADQNDDDSANEVMLDEIDARLRSLQDFLTRTKARA